MVTDQQIEDTKKFIKMYPNLSDQPQETIRRMRHHHLNIRKKNICFKGNYLHNALWPVRPATELVQARVSFKRSQSNNLKDISFTRGVLKLPRFFTSDGIETLLLNYIAYKQIHKEDNRITYYVFLMDNLDTAKDVVLLVEKRIIVSFRGSDDEIASLFNRLTKRAPINIVLNPEDVNWGLKEYCNKRWNKWRANFMQTVGLLLASRSPHPLACQNFMQTLGLLLASRSPHPLACQNNPDCIRNLALLHSILIHARKIQRVTSKAFRLRCHEQKEN